MFLLFLGTAGDLQVALLVSFSGVAGDCLEIAGNSLVIFWEVTDDLLIGE